MLSLSVSIFLSLSPFVLCVSLCPSLLFLKEQAGRLIPSFNPERAALFSLWHLCTYSWISANSWSGSCISPSNQNLGLFSECQCDKLTHLITRCEWTEGTGMHALRCCTGVPSGAIAHRRPLCYQGDSESKPPEGAPGLAWPQHTHQQSQVRPKLLWVLTGSLPQDK